MILNVYLVLLASFATFALIGIGAELGRIKHMLSLIVVKNVLSDKIIEALNKEENK